MTCYFQQMIAFQDHDAQLLRSWFWGFTANSQFSSMLGLGFSSMGSYEFSMARLASCCSLANCKKTCSNDGCEML